MQMTGDPVQRVCKSSVYGIGLIYQKAVMFESVGVWPLHVCVCPHSI